MGEDVAGGAGREDFEDAWGRRVQAHARADRQVRGRARPRHPHLRETASSAPRWGPSAAGLRPIADLMFVGFVGVCGDQIFNNMAKMHYMFGGKVKLPLTVITSTGAGVGSAAQHSETIYSIFVHFPGLKCVAPSNPYNAKGLPHRGHPRRRPGDRLQQQAADGRRGHRPPRPRGGLRGPHRQGRRRQGGHGRYADRHQLHDLPVPQGRRHPGRARLLGRGHRPALALAARRGRRAQFHSEDAQGRDRRRGLSALLDGVGAVGGDSRAGLRLPRRPAQEGEWRRTPSVPYSPSARGPVSYPLPSASPKRRSRRWSRPLGRSPRADIRPGDERGRSA